MGFDMLWMHYPRKLLGNYNVYSVGSRYWFYAKKDCIFELSLRWIYICLEKIPLIRILENKNKDIFKWDKMIIAFSEYASW